MVEAASNTAVAPAPLTLHGTPIPLAVDIYRLAAPAVAPVIAPGPEQDPSPARSSAKGRVWRGALVGSVVGCPVGKYLSRRYNDDAHLINCLWVGGVGAALGAVVGSLY